MRNLQSLVLSSKLLVLATLLATAACSGGGSNPPDASTEAGAEAGKKDAALPPSDAGGGDGGATPTIDPECTVPSGSPSNGSCVAIDDDAGVGCNPVTNEGCNADAGESCDIASDGTIQCFAPPPPNTAALCATCDSNTECLPGSSCWPGTANPSGECMRFCCTDADCGGGHCDKTTFQTDPLGFCAK